MAKWDNRYLRYCLAETTNSIRRYEPEYHAYYGKKYTETPEHKHKWAVVLATKKLMHLADTLLRSHQLYMPPRSVIDK